MRKLFLFAALLACSVLSVATAQTQIGFQAELSDLSTVGISGTVTITGPTTIRFDNFNYDGRGGGLTELRLLPDFDALTLGSNFTFNDIGQAIAYRNEQILDEGIVVTTLRGNDPTPAGDVQPVVNFSGELDVNSLVPTPIVGPGLEFTSLTDLAGISVFCVPQAVDFGSGIFTSPADFNNDGFVDAADYSVYRDSLGTEGLTAGQLGDANSDGAVTQEDFEILIEQFGTVAAAADPNTSALIEALTDHGPGTEAAAPAAAAIPEPAAAALIALAALSAGAARRRQTGC